MRSESRSRSKSPPQGSRPERGQPSEPPTNKVYVTFLPEDIEESKLKQLFEECGAITRLYLKKKDDGFTFAHIYYETVDEAKSAIEKLNRFKVGAKSIRVQFGRENNRSDSRDSRGDRGERGGDRGGERGRGRGGPPRGEGDFRKESDTRRRFEGQGGRGRGNREDRNGGFRGDAPGRREGGGGERELKCFKCQGFGHMARNCPKGDGEERRPQQSSESKGRPSKQAEKMVEEGFSDY